MKKTVEDTLLERSTVRRYEREPIAEEDLQFIREAIRNTPTSYNGQQFSVIEVSDQALKEELAEIVGQKQFKTSARVLIFLSDYNKIKEGARAAGLEYPPFETTVDGMIVGTVDAALAMMSAIVAANSRGLGTCPIGYARTVAPARLNELLGLPKGVYLVCALAIGVPREIPAIKPKQPSDLVFFNNRYGTEDMPAKLLAYDRAFKEYHMSRESNPSDEGWIEEIIGYYAEGMNYTMRQALAEQGYDLK